MREWCPAIADDPRVLDTALDILAEQAKAAQRAAEGRGSRAG